MSNSIETATMGGGCFWCTEAVFQNLKGVASVVSGYSGGNVPGKPTYREVCSGLTGHAEVVQVSFDPEVLSFKALLEVFMTTHDPTTLNQQGADRGTQYRSVIFYHDSEQKKVAQKVLQQMKAIYRDPIVTELSPFSEFFEAEIEHQNYYRDNPQQGYCRYVIDPKVNKLRSLHSDKLKT